MVVKAFKPFKTRKKDAETINTNSLITQYSQTKNTLMTRPWKQDSTSTTQATLTLRYSKTNHD